MSALKSLNFIAMPKHPHKDPVLQRRAKLMRQLEQQRALAADPLYVHPRQKWVKTLNGTRELMDVPKRVKRWWRDDGMGSGYLVIRYGSRVLELEKNKSAIAYTKPEQLIPILDAVIAAVRAGEYDKAIAGIERVGQRVPRKAA